MEIQSWLSYFEKNKKIELLIPYDRHKLTVSERKRITKSIQSFQLGESSEGRTLKAQAQRHRPDYVTAIEHLIREENRHSAYLGRFMSLHSIPKIKQGFNDSCFRFLRRRAGLELSLRVLVTAEVVAMTYYDCLGGATRSAVLGSICKRMLQEESRHVQFQMQNIHEINFQRPSLSSGFINLLHFVFLQFTLWAVWLEHRSVLGLKYNFSEFIKKVTKDFMAYSGQGQRQVVQKAGYFAVMGYK